MLNLLKFDEITFFLLIVNCLNMQFVETAEQSKLKFIAKPLQYQYHIAGSIIFKKINYPDLFNEENNKYYQYYDDDDDDDDSAKSRGFKDFFEIEGISLEK